MTTEQKSKILSLRDSGHGYAAIAAKVGISKDTVKSFCRRNGAAGIRAAKQAEQRNRCPQCGKKLIQAEKQKPRRFCSDQCRQAWWNAHPEMVKQKAVHRLRQQPPKILLPPVLCAGPVPRGYSDMTKEQLHREILYHVSLAPFRQLLEDGHVSRSDYDKIDTILAQKYRPIFVNIMPQN